MTRPSNTLNQEAFLDPQPGDYWHERLTPYFIIVDKCEVDENQYLIVLENTKQAPGNKFYFDVNSPSVYTMFDFERRIKYARAVSVKHLNPENINIFCADVIRTDKFLEIVKEFKEAFPDTHNHSVIKELIDRVKIPKGTSNEEHIRLTLLNEKIKKPEAGTIFYHNHKPFLKVVGFYGDYHSKSHVVYCQQFDNNGFDQTHLSIISKQTFWKLFQAPIHEYSTVA